MNKRLIIALDFDNTRSTLDFLEHVDPDKCIMQSILNNKSKLMIFFEGFQ